MDDVIAVLKEQHTENMAMQGEHKRLLELWTAEQRVANVRTAMLDETLKKLLLSIQSGGITATKLLDELRA